MKFQLSLLGGGVRSGPFNVSQGFGRYLRCCALGFGFRPQGFKFPIDAPQALNPVLNPNALIEP